MKSFHNNCVRLLFHLALQRLASSCARYFCLYHEASIFLNVFSNTDKISFTSSLLSPTAVRFDCFSEYRTIVFFLSDLKWSSHCGYARLAPEHLGPSRVASSKGIKAKWYLGNARQGNALGIAPGAVL